MNQSIPPISNEEAKAALASVETTTQNVVSNFRPPIWLTFIFSMLVAAVTYSTILSGNNSLWTFISYVTSFALLLTVIFLIYRYQAMGIKLNYIPRGIGGKLLNILQAVVVATLIIGGKELYRDGYLWVAYFSSLLNLSICGVMLHYCPTGEWCLTEKKQ
jgi:hypothetical protein